jgi:hypothetical protein
MTREDCCTYFQGRDLLRDGDAIQLEEMRFPGIPSASVPPPLLPPPVLILPYMMLEIFSYIGPSPRQSQGLLGIRRRSLLRQSV